MIKKIKKNLRPMDVFVSGKMRKMARMAKKTTEKTTDQAKQAIRSVSDQVTGTKEHEVEVIDAPRITNETVAASREEILSRARQFIYPLHSRRRVVVISTGIVVGVLSLIILITGLLLYGFKTTGTFTYNISRFIPFPVARVDGEFVPYERYLFEVRNTIHYLKNFAQEGVEIDSEQGEALITDSKRKILDKVQRDELALQLAENYGIEVSDEEIDAQIESYKIRGGINQSEGSLESVLDSYYGWDLNDLKRTLKFQLIRNKLKSVVDTDAITKRDMVVQKMFEGMSFAVAATNYSDDTVTAPGGGRIGTIERSDSQYTALEIEAIFALGEGEVTKALVLPDGFYFYRLDKKISEDSVEISKIVIHFFDLDTYLEAELEKVAHRAYISI